MVTPPTFEMIQVDELLAKVQEMRRQNYRLVQIGATRLPEQVELTYSFDQESQLANLRLHLPAAEAKVPSISSIYWCAFLYENEIHDLFGVQVEGMAVDFKGNLYQTAVKFPFGSTKAPAKPAPAQAPVKPAPAPAPVPTPGTNPTPLVSAT
ncbi:MAG TPA: NADH-quinone oxidoreductase subunit C [Clostridia bacterium]|nr:NADH-quinone oxidoreductase subunit C [Clostridia bacterium]